MHIALEVVLIMTWMPVSVGPVSASTDDMVVALMLGPCNSTKGMWMGVGPWGLPERPG